MENNTLLLENDQMVRIDTTNLSKDGYVTQALLQCLNK